MEIECFLTRPPAIPVTTPSLFPNSNHRKNKNYRFKIKAKTHLHEDDDGNHHPFLQSAITHASYRFRESLRSEPLFVDPYAGCFAPPDLEIDGNLSQKLHNYCIGTRFIDDQLLSATKGVDGAKQVVLFTDGMDTRAYRLKWPSSTVIYDVSPQAVFRKASQMLQDVGAKIPRSCLLLHVPLESSDMQQLLRDKGFHGSRPSIWVFQGFPVTNLATFKEILFMVSSLAMKGCLFLGEFPVWLIEAQVGIKSIVERMDEIFTSYGFRVRIIEYNDVAKDLGQTHVTGDSDCVLFVAEHLRFSDDEVNQASIEPGSHWKQPLYSYGVGERLVYILPSSLQTLSELFANYGIYRVR